MASAFTPITGTIGGSLIGLSASILLLGNGDILGASGIVSSFLKHPIKAAVDPKSRWRVMFLSSFLVTSVFYFQCIIDPAAAASSSLSTTTISSFGYTLAGFFVGLGTKLSNGCTSGHGICGLARFSKRSLVAVITFMTTGVLTGSFLSSSSSSYFHTSSSDTSSMITDTSTLIGTSIVVLVSALLCLPTHPSSSSPSAAQIQQQKESTTTSTTTNTKENVTTTTTYQHERKNIISILSGSLFAMGLAISGMVQNTKVLNFLNVSQIMQGYWDGTLMTVMGSGLLISMLGYQLVDKHCYVCPKDLLFKRPINCHECDGFTTVPTNKVIDLSLILGAASFGIGWGIAGVCPGPAIFLGAIGVSPILTYWWPSYWIGASIGEFIKKYT